MTRKDRYLFLLLALLFGLALGGCGQLQPPAPVAQTPEQLIPEARRQIVPSFQGTELDGEAKLSFPATGRVAIYSFFSPG